VSAARTSIHSAPRRVLGLVVALGIERGQERRHRRRRANRDRRLIARRTPALAARAPAAADRKTRDKRQVLQVLDAFIERAQLKQQAR
jgi:hypothetical protein